MTEVLQPVVRRCVVDGCDQQAVGMACDNPEHQEIAAAMMDTNAGIPQTINVGLSGNESFVEVFDQIMDRSSWTTNYLPESPLGMDVDVRQYHK